jgi:hypothetical protein
VKPPYQHAYQTREQIDLDGQTYTMQQEIFKKCWVSMENHVWRFDRQTGLFNGASMEAIT